MISVARKILQVPFIIIVLAASLGSSVAQVSLPPIPTEFETIPLMFPLLTYQGDIGPEQNEYIFLLLANAGDRLRIEMRRSGGDLIPYIELKDALESTNPLQQTSADDLAGRSATLEYTIDTDGWYFVTFKADPNQPAEGSFQALLTGTTTAIYEFYPLGRPPAIDGSVILAGERIDLRSDDPILYLIPLNSELQLNLVPEQDVEFVLSGVDAEILAESQVDAGDSFAYQAAASTWAILEVRPQDERLRLESELVDAEGVPATLFPAYLSDMLTLTFTPTFTITPSPTLTPTFTPTFTRTFTPTRTPTPRVTNTPIPITCPGTQTSRLIAGEMARVTKGQSNRVRNAPSLNGRELTKMPGDSLFAVLDGPECADNYAWWQIDYKGVIGWTAEGNKEEYWLRPIDMRDQYPPKDRSVPPRGAILLNGGRAIRTERTMNQGNFQIEGYCQNKGLQTSHNGNISQCYGGNTTLQLTVENLDAICRMTYDNPRAFAIQDGVGERPAWRWRCYGYEN